MKTKSTWLALLMLAVLLLLAACGSGDKASDKTDEKKEEATTPGDADKAYVIGISQIVEHPSLNAATEGFKKALEESGLQVTFDEQVAQGDNSLNTTIATNFVSSGVDLIFANSTPSAQAAAGQTTDIPIIFTSVTDAVGAQLIDAMEAPGKNITGTIDLHPDTIKNTVAFLKEELGAETIGMVYNAGEQNSVAQIDQVKEEAEKVGLKVEEASASNSSEVKQASESIVNKVDAFYIITDNTVVSALESVIDVADGAKKPLIVGELDSVERGGLAAYGFSYEDLGYEAGQMAVKVLKGEAKIEELAAQHPQNLKLVVNKKAADALDLDIKEDWGAEVIN